MPLQLLIVTYQTNAKTQKSIAAPALLGFSTGAPCPLIFEFVSPVFWIRVRCFLNLGTTPFIKQTLNIG